MKVSIYNVPMKKQHKNGSMTKGPEVLPLKKLQDNVLNCLLAF